MVLPHTMWRVWKVRNDVIFRNTRKICTKVVKEIIIVVKYNIERFKPPKNKLYPEEEEHILAAWNIGTDSIKHKDNNNIDGSSIHWIQPPTAWYKLNFDGASKGNPGDLGGGGVIRDHRGCFVATFSGKM
ncbi:hypothetical protein KI387_036683, partial [Taxus chinensis]